MDDCLYESSTYLITDLILGKGKLAYCVFGNFWYLLKRLLLLACLNTLSHSHTHAYVCQGCHVAFLKLFFWRTWQPWCGLNNWTHSLHTHIILWQYSVAPNLNLGTFIMPPMIALSHALILCNVYHWHQ